MTFSFGEITGGRKKKAAEDCCCAPDLCCDDRCVPVVVRDVDGIPTNVPNDACSNLLPEAFTVDLTGTPSFGSSNCFNGTGTITFKTALDGGQECWEGPVSGSCVDCNGATFNWSFLIRLCCMGQRRFSVQLAPIGGTICPALALGTEGDATMCDPFLLSVCWPEFGGCFVGCLDDNQMPIPEPSFVVCAEIYETP
jgi:hypothetical protein